MATINAYLNFNGSCEAAFNFYKSVFGGDFTYIGRYKDMPQSEDGCSQPMPEGIGDKIMHVSLPISTETVLMGSDAPEGFGPALITGNNISLSVNVQSKEEADKIFNALAEKGTVTMPIATTFWSAYFGMLIDQFGINWMVNFDQPPVQA